MSLRSVNLLSIAAQIPAACCVKVYFTLDETLRLAIGELLMFFYNVRIP